MAHASAGDGTFPGTLDALPGPLILARGMKTRHCVNISFLCAHAFQHAANNHHVHSAIRRALSFSIAKVANGIRRLDGCDVQIVPVRAGGRWDL